MPVFYSLVNLLNYYNSSNRHIKRFQQKWPNYINDEGSLINL